MQSHRLFILTLLNLLSSSSAQAPLKPENVDLVATGGTYPHATKFADGETLVGACTDARGDNNTITTVKPIYNDASWQPMETVETSPKATKDIDNPCIYEHSDCKILSAFRNHGKSGPTTYSFYRITMSISENGGRSWRCLQTPVSNPSGVTGDWEPFLQQALGDSMQLHYSRENSATD